MRTFNPAGVDVQYTVDLLHLSYQGHVIYTGTSTVQYTVDLLHLSYQGHVIYTGTGKSTVQYSTRGRHSRIIGIFYSREMVSVQVQYRTLSLYIFHKVRSRGYFN